MQTYTASRVSHVSGSNESASRGALQRALPGIATSTGAESIDYGSKQQASYGTQSSGWSASWYNPVDTNYGVGLLSGPYQHVSELGASAPLPLWHAHSVNKSHFSRFQDELCSWSPVECGKRPKDLWTVDKSQQERLRLTSDWPSLLDEATYRPYSGFQLSPPTVDSIKPLAELSAHNFPHAASMQNTHLVHRDRKMARPEHKLNSHEPDESDIPARSEEWGPAYTAVSRTRGPGYRTQQTLESHQALQRSRVHHGDCPNSAARVVATVPSLVPSSRSGVERQQWDLHDDQAVHIPQPVHAGTRSQLHSHVARPSPSALLVPASPAVTRQNRGAFSARVTDPAQALQALVTSGGGTAEGGEAPVPGASGVAGNAAGGAHAELAPAPAPARTPRRQPVTTDFTLWVGNLPPRTAVMDLLTKFGHPGIVSMYLINRTGCAFINYTSDEALNESVSLMRARGGTVRDHKIVSKSQKKAAEPRGATDPEVASTFGARDRYFICKSLAVQDLERARHDGLWSTQEHNREKFNAAFRTSENVYFVFSANRNSAFSGYARMDSLFPPAEKPAVVSPCTNTHSCDSEIVGVVAEDGVSSPPELSSEEYLLPAQSANGLEYPAGRVVDDENTGSLFWEAIGHNLSQKSERADQWTAPCHITWLSSPTAAVPFGRTRQLRNALNTNKPIKIARDGTEIEPVVAGQLIELFSMF